MKFCLPVSGYRYVCKWLGDTYGWERFVDEAWFSQKIRYWTSKVRYANAEHVRKIFISIFWFSNNFFLFFLRRRFCYFVFVYFSSPFSTWIYWSGVPGEEGAAAAYKWLFYFFSTPSPLTIQPFLFLVLPTIGKEYKLISRTLLISSNHVTHSRGAIVEFFSSSVQKKRKEKKKKLLVFINRKKFSEKK